MSKLESTKMLLMRLMMGIAQVEWRMIEKMMEGSRLHVIFHKEMRMQKEGRTVIGDFRPFMLQTSNVVHKGQISYLKALSVIYAHS